MTDWSEISRLTNEIDIILNDDFLNGGDENKIKILQCYDYVCNRCEGHLEEKIKDFVLFKQDLFIPLLKVRFSQQAFEMELDYLYFLLECFNSHVISSIKDEWIDFLLKYKFDDCYFCDAMRIICKHHAAPNSQLIPLIQEKRKIYLDRIAEIGYVDESNHVKFLDYWDMAKQEMKDANYKIIHEEWEKVYGEKDKILTYLYWNKQYLSELDEILNSMVK